MRTYSTEIGGRLVLVGYAMRVVVEGCAGSSSSRIAPHGKQ